MFETSNRTSDKNSSEFEELKKNYGYMTNIIFLTKRATF